MLIGTFIQKMGAATFNSPQFPRGGLAAVFSAEALGEVGATSMTIDVEHRNADETSWTVAGTFSAITATGVVVLNVTGLKEIIRFKYSFSGGSDGDGFLINVAAPAWRPY